MADIGTDHGFLPLYLLEKGISPKVIMTDISPNSLDKARNNFEEGDKGTVLPSSFAVFWNLTVSQGQALRYAAGRSPVCQRLSSHTINAYYSQQVTRVGTRAALVTAPSNASADELAPSNVAAL